MKLTNGQERARKGIMDWIRGGKASGWLYTLGGYAGTGKTTLLDTIFEEIGGSMIVRCCAPTGKAASVFAEKIRYRHLVKTVHSTLYVPKGANGATLLALERALEDGVEKGLPHEKIKELEEAVRREMEDLAKGGFRFALKENPDVREGMLVVCDEGSMLSRRMMEDFQRTGAKLLVVGDPMQLPPVRSEVWFQEIKHDQFLEDIVRQALDNPIIRLSLQIRERFINVSDFKTGACILCSKEELSKEDWLSADQILTGSNQSRRRINRFSRKSLGYSGKLPMAGEKLICLKNNFEQIPAWINGTLLRATSDATDLTGTSFAMDMEYSGVRVPGVQAYSFNCLAHYLDYPVEVHPDMRKEWIDVDFAYAITVHKSQGSEWPYVIVADDKMMKGDKDFRQKWLYTAATRAKERLHIIQ